MCIRDREDLLRALVAEGGPDWAMLSATDCGILGILSADSFDDVDHAIETHIRPLDGVLRLKRDWIIDLTQL